MQSGAQTPEELETLLEDAFVMHDARVLAQLFDHQAVLGDGQAPAARGRSEIVRAAETLWAREQTYLAAPLRVLQTRSMALITGPCGASVARRSGRGAWRYSIALLQPQTQRSRR
jgi:hypothetical protein